MGYDVLGTQWSGPRWSVYIEAQSGSALHQSATVDVHIHTSSVV